MTRHRGAHSLWECVAFADADRIGLISIGAPWCALMKGIAGGDRSVQPNLVCVIAHG